MKEFLAILFFFNMRIYRNRVSSMCYMIKIVCCCFFFFFLRITLATRWRKDCRQRREINQESIVIVPRSQWLGLLESWSNKQKKSRDLGIPPQTLQQPQMSFLYMCLHVSQEIFLGFPISTRNPLSLTVGSYLPQVYQCSPVVCASSFLIRAACFIVRLALGYCFLDTGHKLSPWA